jgi:hypothetical protein
MEMNKKWWKTIAKEKTVNNVHSFCKIAAAGWPAESDNHRDSGGSVRLADSVEPGAWPFRVRRRGCHRRGDSIIESESSESVGTCRQSRLPPRPAPARA